MKIGGYGSVYPAEISWPYGEGSTVDEVTANGIRSKVYTTSSGRTWWFPDNDRRYFSYTSTTEKIDPSSWIFNTYFVAYIDGCYTLDTNAGWNETKGKWYPTGLKRGQSLEKLMLENNISAPTRR